MGYPAQNTSIAALIAMLGDLKHYAKKEGEMTHYYYKPVIALLNHKLIKSSCSEDIPKITNYINTNNIVYVAEKSLQFSEITRTIFSSSEENLLDYLLRILKQLIASIQPESHEGLAIEKEFLFTIFTTIQGIKNTFIEENIIPDNKFYLQIIHKILQGVSIPFSGEPLEGMQIMGLMETRMLDFKNLIILSATREFYRKADTPRHLSPTTCDWDSDYQLRNTWMPFSPITFTASCNGLKTSNYCTLMSRKA